jgi:endonuclease YncB( thermonuclease family)
MPTVLNAYRASLIAPSDGDTFRARIELLPFLFHEGRVRLARCNAPELATDAGKASAAFAAAWLAGAAWPINAAPHAHVLALHPAPYPLVLTVLGYDNYGRILAECFRTLDGRNLTDDLLTQGLAQHYPLKMQLAVP